MNAHRINATLRKNGSITLTDLPFRRGDSVEVIVLSGQRESEAPSAKKYPLRGMPYTYVDPTEPVALDDWEILK